MIAMKHAPHRASRAFTLIEIMVVVALIALVMTMGLPAIFSATRRDPMTQTIKDLSDACRTARSQAIISGNVTALRIYPTGRRITVDAPQAAAPKPDELAAGAPATNAPAGFSADLSDRVRIDMLDVNFIDCRAWEGATVFFNANGTCDEFNMVLESDDGQARRFVLDVATGFPDITALR